MSQSSRVVLAVLTAVLIAFTFAPARAAGIPAGSALALDQAGRLESAQVQYRHRSYRGRTVYRSHVYRGRPAFRHRVVRTRPIYRPAYYGSPVYYGGPVYVGRRCVNRVRWVHTAYGPVRRIVRVCRW